MSLKRIITSVAVTASMALPVALPAATFASSGHNYNRPSGGTSQSGLINVGDVKVLNDSPILSGNQVCANVGLSLLANNDCGNLVLF